MAEILETTQRVVLSVRIRGDESGPQTGDVVLEGNVFGNFSEEEHYNKNEAVIKDGNIYRSKDDVAPGEWNPDDWECLTDITMRIYDFQPNHEYKENEVIQVEGHLYRAPMNFITGADFDYTEWEAIDSVNTILNSFEPNADYSKHEIVEYQGKIYRAKRQFVSGSGFDYTDWEIVSDLVVADFAKNTNYQKGNVVVSSGKLYRAKDDFTSGNVWEPKYWEAINSTGVGGFESNNYYPAGSMIYVDGKLYVAKKDFTSKTEFDSADWEVVSETKAKDYNNNQTYQKDEIVYHNGKLYRARKDFVSGTSFNIEDWEIVSSAKTGGFEPNTAYLEGTIIYQDGILWIARKDFTSDANFNASDWTPLTLTEQETYDSWKNTGTTVKVDGLVETFVSRNNPDTYLQNEVQDELAAMEIGSGKYSINSYVDDTEAYVDLVGEKANAILRTNGIGFDCNDTYFSLQTSKATVGMSDDLASEFGSAIATASVSQKGTVKSDDTTTRVLNDVMTAYPIPDVFTSGHDYKQYELCTYKNQVYSAKNDFTASSWNPADWYPIRRTIGEYKANETYFTGDLILVDDQLYFANKDIASAPASRVAADWTILQVNADNIIVNTTGNEIAKSNKLTTAIQQLDADLSIAVKPVDDATRYLFTVQDAGTTPPAAVPGKTIICLYTE